MFPAFHFSKIAFITDGEQALINSISKKFPESSRLRCSSHIEKNVIFNLRKHKMSYANKTTLKRKLKSLIFSESIFVFGQIKEEVLKITMDEKARKHM